MTAPTPRTERLRSVGHTLNLELSPGAVATLSEFVDLLHRWNATYNLTAIRDPDEMLTHHLADCLAAVSAVNARFGTRALRVLDVGSGGGLPGVVWATVRSQDTVVCVDTVGKKAAFVRQASVELRLANLHSEHARVEQLDAPPFDIVTSRAFATLADFVQLSGRLVRADGCWLAMKGKLPDLEMRGLSRAIDVFHVEQLKVPGLDAERCLVWMRRATPPEGA